MSTVPQPFGSGSQAPPRSGQPPRLLDRVRETIRMLHYSRSTEDTYVSWIRRFVLFHHKRHPLEMGKVEIGQFLSHLAVNARVAASTQNQALNALAFLYRRVLQIDIGMVEDVVRAKRPKRLPVVLTREEVKSSWGRRMYRQP